jgi:DNA-binding transcriptional MerR regulator
MNAQPARSALGIGEVLARLRPEFPDITISKIRFLESEGLIEPARSPSRYRQFDQADVERLRFILTAQRDQYLPLRVIKEQLASQPDPAAPGRPPAGAQAARRGGPPLSRRELQEAAGIDEDQLAELETYGLIRRTGRHYGPDALEVARTVAALAAYGVQARHLGAVRAAAERDTSLIEQVIAPTLRQRNPGAREGAGRTARAGGRPGRRRRRPRRAGQSAARGRRGQRMTGQGTGRHPRERVYVEKRSALKQGLTEGSAARAAQRARVRTEPP